MFPNNLPFVEKMVHTKQDDLMREIQSDICYELPLQPDAIPQARQRPRVLMVVGLLIMVGWLFSLIA